LKGGGGGGGGGGVGVVGEQAIFIWVREEGWGFQGLCVLIMDGYDLCTGTIQTLLAGGQLLGLGAHFGLTMGSFYFLFVEAHMYRRSVVNVQRERWSYIFNIKKLFIYCKVFLKVIFMKNKLIFYVS
jgi:hypothetical protein